MKYTILLIGFLLFNELSYAQEEVNTKNAARFGYNGVFFGSGDNYGQGIYGEFSHSLNSFIAVTPRIMIAQANYSSESSFEFTSLFCLSFSLKITPLPKLFSRLKIDIGGLYGRNHSGFGRIEKGYNDNEYFSSNMYYTKENSFGLLGSISVNILEREKIESGLRFDMLTSFDEGYLNSDSMQFGVYLGFKF